MPIGYKSAHTHPYPNKTAYLCIIHFAPKIGWETVYFLCQKPIGKWQGQVK